MYKYKKIKLKDGTTRDEHRLIMEKELGRKLAFNECVHHKDGNKRNNSRDNLEVVDRSEHMKMHIDNGDIVSPPISKESKVSMCIKNSTVDEETAKRIKYGKESARDLLLQVGISKSAVSRIRNNKSWRHI